MDLVMISIFQQQQTHPACWCRDGFWDWKITIWAPIMVLLMVFHHYAECLIDSRHNKVKKINWQVFDEFVAQYENLIGGHQSTTRSQARAWGGMLVIMNWVCWRAAPFLGTLVLTKTDEFSENFRRGGGGVISELKNFIAILFAFTKTDILGLSEQMEIWLPMVRCYTEFCQFQVDAQIIQCDDDVSLHWWW